MCMSAGLHIKMACNVACVHIHKNHTYSISQMYCIKSPFGFLSNVIIMHDNG